MDPSRQVSMTYQRQIIFEFSVQKHKKYNKSQIYQEVYNRNLSSNFIDKIEVYKSNRFTHHSDEKVGDINNSHFDKSEQNYRLSIDLSEELEDLTAAVIAHWGIADLAMIRGDGQMAMEHYSQALASQIQTGSPAPPELLKRIDAITGNE